MQGEKRIVFKTLVNGGPGTGKSFFGLTHPKVAWLVTEPGWEPLFQTHPMKENLVWVEDFIPSPNEDIKKVFERLDKACDQAHADAKAGKVETLFLDNVSFLSENRWLYINQYEKQVAANGSIDTRGMYGSLSRWLYNFTLMKLLSFPGHVVVSCHEATESEDNLKKNPHLDSAIVPNILGGFREKVSGMFGASIYLDKVIKGPGVYKYVARCQQGANRAAKNRFGLPEIVEDITFQKLIEIAKVSTGTNGAVKQGGM
jgi:hypothetical protein